MDTPKKLYRSSTNKVIFGVCAGLAEYFAIDPLIVRALFILFTFMGGGAVILYLILALVIPSDNPAVSSKEEVKEFAHDLEAKVQSVAGELKSVKSEKNSFGSGRRFFGFVVLLFGLFFLLKEIMPWPMYHFYFSWFRWDLFWPLVVMIIGLYLIVKNNES